MQLSRAAGALLTLVGLTLVLVAVMLGVLLGPAGEWSAHAQVAAGRSAIVLQPALVSVLGARVTVTAAAADAGLPGGAALFVGRARSDDITGYVRDSPYAGAATLRTSRQLRLDELGGGSRLPPPETVDVWQQQSASRTLAWTPTPGAQSVVVTRSDGAALPAIDVTVSWQQRSWRAIPAVPLAVGAVLLTLGWLARRYARRRSSRGAARPLLRSEQVPS